MARYDFRTPRLYVGDRLAAGARLMLPAPQMHYLMDVLRLKPGDGALVFNGSDGEWRGTLVDGPKRAAILLLDRQTRGQTAPCGLHYLFAPLKRSRLDYMVQKAVEMGVSRLQPVLTRHTQAERVNTARMRANAIEAAEQCGVLNLPEVAEPATLASALAALAPGRLLVFCDEDAPLGDPLEALAAARPYAGHVPPLAVLVGPEGGFHPDERALLLDREGVVRLALGPRILRADTAAVAALALVQATLGDWGPRSVADAGAGETDRRFGEGAC
jgi:16S rRNA (uracil1498-N3)-methyltransferase